ncbi:hypothetical protein KTE19_10970 [Lentilactobacillus sp. IMAU92037]|uniref:hypothetical protein n=1 Tax=Lentilactobacillus dabitei TaxID=2831523 RepID=UPI001C2730C3|nr:hypothetical protein [Lentilactobacillus dabitei]MBU9789148.1 hypothetical protein [Lentilactobacillus dabitei]MBV0931209.1 hypothetical protein [Lentilactobacillus dabitei]
MMNQKYESWFIQLLSIGSLLAFIVQALLTAIVAFGTLATLIIGNNPNFPLIAKLAVRAHSAFTESLVTILIVIGVLIFRTIIIFALYKLLRQFHTNDIFNDRNLSYIRWCSYSFGGLVIFDGMLALIWKFLHFEAAVSYGQSLFAEILAWFTIYVIYIIFKRGLALKKENEDFV